jgi:site-specific DNA-cytosine methylase
VDSAKQSLTTLSLCTGYSGIERGLELAGEALNVLAHVEIEAFAIANLVAKMEEGKLAPSPIWTNLKTLPVEPFRDRVDLITGGYPCQPFSAAGKRAGTDDPRHLWPYIREIIESVRPVRCFFENVEGHISLGLREVISDLEGLGYKTAWGIFSASEVGAPHRRKRVFIMADDMRGGLQNTPNEPSEGRAESEASLGTRATLQSQASGNGKAELADSQGIERRQGYQNSTGVDERSGEGKIHITTGLRESGRSTELADSLANSISAAARDNSGTSTDKGREPSAVGSASLRQAHGEELPDRAGAASANSTAELADSQGEYAGNVSENFRALSREVNTPLNSSSLGGGDDKPSDRKTVADSISARSKAGISGQKRSNQEGHSGITNNSCGEQGGGQGGMCWAPEPNVGRVVDGCANRVDRIRLLGNGVVPQTAAKAWTVLDSEMAK